ncbi:MAG: type VI secretion system baseplate subunit TssG [Gammaproteobacteria bacterium]|nr:type VI secretion system baseplate subunit TssG [Gammaproteobacteria bacterium]
MASQDRSTANHIVSDLIEHSQQYSFFQAVKLLNDYNQLVSDDEGKEALKNTLIQFSVNPQLAYNSSDIEAVVIEETNEQFIAQMSVNFMGLYGATSPLPAFYSESILQAKNGDDSTKDFMDLFNHRMISLVYKCWEKYRYYQQYKHAQYSLESGEGGKTDQFTNWMFSLCGLVRPEQRNDPNVDWNRLLPFIGLLGMRCHSASAIESVLRFYFKFKNIFICPNIQRFVEIEDDQQNRLGTQCVSLSNNLVLGQRVEDRSGKFRIKITELTYERFLQFLPDGENYMSLRKIVDYVLRDQLDYDIELQLIKQEIPKLSLSHHNNEKLGWTTWFGSHNQENKSVIVPGRA